MRFPSTRPPSMHPPSARPRLVLGVAAAVLALVVVAGTAVALRAVPAAAPDGAADGRPAAPAGPGGPAGDHRCAGVPLAATRELRAMWLTTVNNIDWPSRPGLTAEQIKQEYLDWLALAQRLRHNAVFVHVRPSGDALWPSPYAPWSEWLTGVRGRDPGFDVLGWAVEQTHARGLQFHAWFNPYRGSQPASVGGAGGDLAALAPTHPLRAHPEWAVVHPARGAGRRLYFDPGNPQARRYVEDSILDAVRRYDIDGVHFDDFFYPYPGNGQPFADDASFAAHGAGFRSRADWRRHNTDTFIRELSERIKQEKPWVAFGVSPFGIWRNARTDPAGSATRGLQAYDDIYADTRRWVRERWLDYIVPQLYWHIGFDVADYAELLPWWAAVVEGTGVRLYVGQADYRVGEKGAWSRPDQLSRQLALNRKHGVAGSVHYNATSVRRDRLGAVSRYAADHYAQPALVPALAPATAHRAAPPPAPRVTVRREPSGGTSVTWRGAAASYAVYRVEPAAPRASPARASAPAQARLVATVAGGDGGAWTDPAGGAAAYCVTGLDRFGAEGPAG